MRQNFIVNPLKARLTAIAFCFGLWGGAAPAIEVTDQDMEALSLDRLDEIILDVERSIDLLRASTGSDVRMSDNELDPGDSTGPALQRSRAILCFADNLGDQTTPDALQSYFRRSSDEIDSSRTRLVAFNALTAITERGQCPSTMTDLLGDARGALRSVDRADLSELILHLETCWPDEGVTLDMDAQYYKARGILQQTRVLQRDLRDAAEWCE